MRSTEYSEEYKIQAGRTTKPETIIINIIVLKNIYTYINLLPKPMKALI